MGAFFRGDGPPWLRRGFALYSGVVAVRLSTVAALVVACNGPGATSSSFTTPGVTTRPDESSSGGSSSTSDSSSSTSGSSSGSGSADSSGTSTTEAMFPDMGMQSDFGGPSGCKGKIDFLFVVSRAADTADMQDKLVAAAPDFIATIQEQFDEFDLHVMVVDSEEDWWVLQCEEMTCGTCDIDPNYPCDHIPTKCDDTLGAGTVFNVGPGTFDMPCDLGEHRYITKDTSDIPGAFECIARVGAWGSNKMGDALVAAVSPQFNASDPVPGCNAGFLRDDALLVLTMIGPEDAPGAGDSKDGSWQDWRQAVVDAKHGDLDAIVALGIVSGEGCELDPHPNRRLCNLIPSFPRSILEPLALEDYSGTFDNAAVLALDACSVFVPG
jgi:hypothetical protein